MGRPLIDITGNKYKMLTAIRFHHREGNHTFWVFKCDCENEVIARTDSVIHGKTHSCGCYQKQYLKDGGCLKTHGMSRTVIYDRWQGMMDRCYREHDKSYSEYGGRGISVYSEWHEFESYYQWAINNGYSDKLTLDRKDVNGNYEPSNCRFITVKAQQRNKRNNIMVKHNGTVKCIMEWCEILGTPIHLPYQRYAKGVRNFDKLFAPSCRG